MKRKIVKQGNSALTLTLPSSWAKKFNFSCNTCHTVFPRLNAFGEAFLANGYQLESTYKKNWEDQYSINAGDVFLDELVKLTFILLDFNNIYFFFY